MVLDGRIYFIDIRQGITDFKMEDFFKKFLYTGVGLASLTAEKLQESIDDLVGKGKLSEKEGKKILNNFYDSTEAKKDEFESKLKEIADQMKDRFNFASLAEVDQLKARVAELEAKLEKMEGKNGADEPSEAE
ncbi:MAG: hypothetical protein MRZ79_11705 [Bacteroidia bacterium]|nr:hypothetical protein [Bacteroidia bacterium]